MKLGVSYFGNRSPKHVARDMEDIAKSNCNFVVHTFSENDLAYYKKAMKEIVSISHDLGLEVYTDPWSVGNVFGGEAFSDFVAKNPDTWQVLSSKEIIPRACLNSEKFRRFMKDWIIAAYEIGSDVIFWDEPHMFLSSKPDEKAVFSCVCELCQKKFKGKFGRPMPSGLTPDVHLFIGETIAGFLKDMSLFSKRHKMKNAVCVYAKEEYEPFWDIIASIKSIDIFGTDPYWRFAKKSLRPYVTYYTKKVLSVCEKHNKEAQLWIQAVRIPKGCEREIEEAIDIVSKEGIKNIAAWSYHAGGLIDTLASKNPQLVWKTLTGAYGRLLAQE
ncbi:MAG: hypothetical protein ABH868_01365 [bacterium]